jgi:hypothetical protein
VSGANGDAGQGRAAAALSRQAPGPVPLVAKRWL